MFTVHCSLIWIAVMILCAIVEGVTAGLVSIWFVIGALASLILSMAFPSAFWVQMVIFLVVSLAAMLLLRPLTRKYFTPHTHATNADRVIGQEGVVIVNINNLEGTGQINVTGQIWSARSHCGEPISEGTHVRVLRIEGVKVLVEPLSAPIPAADGAAPSGSTMPSD